MNTRRKFLQQTLLGSLAVGNADFLFNQADWSEKTDKNAFPAVISTWAPNIKANVAAWQVLAAGGYALDAVEAGVRVPEADPNDTSVGYGGFPDRDGHVTLDACIMNEKGMAGCVTFLEHIMHPISVARKVMENTPHVQLVGDGALQFALASGFQKEPDVLSADADKAYKQWLKKSEYKPVINIEQQQSQGQKTKGGPFAPNFFDDGTPNHDTMGTIAMDASGNLSGACTTSGMAFKMHGRVGDSPIIGAGLYVDNEVGAVTGSGQGEEVIRVAGAFLIVEMMRMGKSPEEACKIAIDRIVKINPVKAKDFQVGFIAINKQGEYGAYSIHHGFNFSVTHSDDGGKVFMAKSHFPKG